MDMLAEFHDFSIEFISDFILIRFGKITLFPNNKSIVKSVIYGSVAPQKTHSGSKVPCRDMVKLSNYENHVFKKIGFFVTYHCSTWELTTELFFFGLAFNPLIAGMIIFAFVKTKRKNSLKMPFSKRDDGLSELSA